MRKRIVAGLADLTAGLLLSLGAPATAVAQKTKAKDKTKKAAPVDNGTAPKFLFGHDFKVRPGGKKDFSDAIRIGVEVFQDEASNSIVAISEAGALAVLPKANVGKDSSCIWVTAHDLSARKPDELDFTQHTKKYGVELFQDSGTNRLIYACETASIAFAPIPAGLVKDRGPKWHHGMFVKVRAPEQVSFENAKQIGLEVFKDENTGGLIYISEKGGIATAPAPEKAPDKNKIIPPKTAYGLVLRVRKADEPDFTEKTKRVGVEVFQDPNANDLLLYVTEAGSVATAPNPGPFLPDAKGVTWKSAMVLKARKGGEKEFDKATKYGIEVFEDNRTGNQIFISETGAIAVLPKK
ncbi:MAG TPA: hypothetical protein VLM40_21530 [Gemmata sp.]|nr:hypothetical protein [Gemmata sp.]